MPYMRLSLPGNLGVDIDLEHFVAEDIEDRKFFVEDAAIPKIGECICLEGARKNRGTPFLWFIVNYIEHRLPKGKDWQERKVVVFLREFDPCDGPIYTSPRGKEAPYDNQR